MISRAAGRKTDHLSFRRSLVTRLGLEIVLRKFFPFVSRDRTGLLTLVFYYSYFLLAILLLQSAMPFFHTLA